MIRARAMAPAFAAFLVVAALLTLAIVTNRAAPPQRSALAEAFAAAGASSEFNVTRWELIEQSVGDDVAEAAGRNAIVRSLLAGSDAEIAEQLSWRVTDLAWETYVPGVDGFVVVRFGPTVDGSDAGLREEFVGATLTPTVKRFARHVEVRDGVLAAGPNAEVVSAALTRAVRADVTAAGAELAHANFSAASLWVRRGDLECRPSARSSVQWSVRALELRDEPTDLQTFARLFADVNDARADARERRDRLGQVAGQDAVSIEAAGHVSVVTLPVAPDEREFMSGTEPPGFAACALD